MTDRDELDAARRAAVEAMGPNGGLPDALERWRREHPYRSASWRVEKTGGWVFVAHDGIVYYWGPCRDCPTGRVTTQRRETKGVSGNGRWPELCDDCRAAKYEDPHGTESRRQVRKSRNPNYDDMRRYNNHPSNSLRN